MKAADRKPVTESIRMFDTGILTAMVLAVPIVQMVSCIFPLVRMPLAIGIHHEMTDYRVAP